jgi:hypothetical protein
MQEHQWSTILQLYLKFVKHNTVKATYMLKGNTLSLNTRTTEQNTNMNINYI